MPVSEKRPWLICYDIADPRRLGRVHRYLSKHAIPLQYSVFIAQINKTQLDGILSGLIDLIEEKEDDVRTYPLTTQTSGISIGNSILPDHVEVIETASAFKKRSNS